MLLNCDLGESFGSWTMGEDELAMAHIDLANIACGFHGGDPLVMQRTLALAKQHGVHIGAHPSYPDRQGFGRRSMVLSPTELIADLHYQIAALAGMAKVQGLQLEYVKPHGALYNDMMAKEQIFVCVLQAVAQYDPSLKLMILAGNNSENYRELADKQGVSLLFEAFADRRYTDAGTLMPRNQAGSVLTKTEMLVQVQQLVSDGTVQTDGGNTLALKADTLCVHGDNLEAVNAIIEIRALCVR
ncbi:5-oxoprolinase subunit PxpA [Pseudoalteromonas sp. BDTF-M6]|uniref:5-oxoprolinase subunit PxpA n=1 Tax=Pseudoalteromonas sp. BDTF-M6 TaxID=2796132 RepID=UPI001BAFFF38|nr:5-oxoprolinase subunit PxpA [Pseudoalteromonas sp. BDTF-M6]MBS3797985.1 5-oxoprolinase subunit PxpA [Pseudoalteromonas sp. BDTF-M6]